MGHLEELLKGATEAEGKSVTFRLTEAERKRVNAACRNRGLDRGDFLRAITLDAVGRLEAMRVEVPTSNAPAGQGIEL